MTVTLPQPTGSSEPGDRLPPLENGDHLDQPTFHARYKAMPEGVRAELIGGIVFMPSPVSRRHGKTHPGTLHWLVEFQAEVKGVEVLADTTVILGLDEEPQPDACLRILPEYGGRTHGEDDDFIHGAPELVVEIAATSEAIDLHRKKGDYERAGVEEYLVVLLKQKEVRWFVLEAGAYRSLEPGADGIFRSRVYPGLWLDPAALLQGNIRAVQEVLRQGLASPEHEAWAAALTARAPC